MEYQFKIKLQGISKPPVWRRVIVPANFTFMQFHQVIQIAFGWESIHLFAFGDEAYHGNIRIGDPEDDLLGTGKIKDASKIKLSEIFTTRGYTKFIYLYDFGDDWIHEITWEATTNSQQMKAYCVNGKGTCPPEDCGGFYGYESMKFLLREAPYSEEAAFFREWLGLDEDEVWNANEPIHKSKINDMLAHV